MLLDLLFHHHRLDPGTGGGKKKWYVRRKKQIHLFDSAQDADAFIESEVIATQVISKAQKSARKVVVKPVESFDIEQLGTLAERYSQFDSPVLIAQQDYTEIILAIQQQNEDDDIEMLLIAVYKL